MFKHNNRNTKPQTFRDYQKGKLSYLPALKSLLQPRKWKDLPSELQLIAARRRLHKQLPNGLPLFDPNKGNDTDPIAPSRADG
ncbi:hypothetical protein [Vibrio sp. ABG19]|uniref:hypothetical protein n=1 Tax=Vibrio sp. ABG19 TaxID=2817385 RepID=UPI00249E1984|nr:hypothetical protein [Vibrio sp. ABG19]WGY48394.1 hypothetical protein J0X00_12530 [Vibrio sp. ABG19]